MDLPVTNQSRSSEDVLLQLNYEIEEDVKAELEDFVRLSHSGQFKDAHELFDECLSSHDGWYPIAAEYADCLLREGDFKQLTAFCEKASMKFQDLRETALLELMFGIGSLLPRDIMWQRLQVIWPALSLRPLYTSLKDTDIHLLEIVLHILVFSRLYSEDLETSLSSDESSARSWSAFKDWYYYLLDHGYFWEAHRILHGLFYELPRLECRIMIHHYIEKVLSTNIDQESVMIAVSSTVQDFIYAFKSTHPSVLAAVQWNDAVTWALFGVTLAQVDECSTSLFSRICLRRSLELELDKSLPLDGVNENDKSIDLLHEAAMYGDVAVLEALTARPSLCTLDELNGWALSSAALLYSHNLLPFLDPKIVDAVDGYQRTPLHWAALIGQGNAVETLLTVGKANAGLLDWFGCTPLHYAVRSWVPGSQTNHLEIVKALAMSDSASVNTKDLTGQTPLYMAIVNQSYDVAEILLEYNTTIETRDYGALLLFGGTNIDGLSRWKQLLSKYDHSSPSLSGLLSKRNSEIHPSLTSDLEALMYKKASLSHRGTIDLDTYAALLLRKLHSDYRLEFLPTLRSFAEHESSGFASSTYIQVQSDLTKMKRSLRLTAAGRSLHESGSRIQDSTLTFPT